MRVILEVISGPDKGRKSHLNAQQSVTVGRTEWSEFVVPHDPRMSSEHFTLQVGGNTCHLRDKDSRNGTFVNGRQVKKDVELFDGDKILAGGTNFVVWIGHDSLSGPPTTPLPLPASRPVASDADDHVLLSSPTVMVTAGAHGLYEAHCEAELLPIRELTDRVQRLLPVYAIVDFSKLEAPAPAELIDPQPLFGWLPEAARTFSPLIIDLQKSPTALNLLESGWGKDAVVCFVSEMAPEQLVEHLRGCARMRRDAVLGFCWPSVLSVLLANCTHEMVQRLLQGMIAVYAENPDAPTQWQMFSCEDLGQLLNRLDLPTESAQAAS